VIVHPWMTLRILQTDAHQQSGKVMPLDHAGMWQGRLPRCKQTCRLRRQLQVQPPGKWKQPEQMTERSSRWSSHSQKLTVCNLAWQMCNVLLADKWALQTEHCLPDDATCCNMYV